jgi:hypothetical protein
MGAFCILWGRRKVRFFYWFFIVFDYVRAPALLLLPLWLGWELLQWSLRDGERVAYEAHAGGIVGGVVLGWLLARFGGLREAYFDSAAAPAGPSIDAELAQARSQLGHLRLAEAEALLAGIEQREPGRFDVALLRYRCARYAGTTTIAERLLQALLQRSPATAEQAREQAAMLAEWRHSGGPISNPLRQRLVPRLLAQGAVDEAIALAAGWDDSADPAAGAQLLLNLALGLHERGAENQACALLGTLQKRYAGAVQAEKAGFLLQAWEPRPVGRGAG